jgi:hypothetical protein
MSGPQIRHRMIPWPGQALYHSSSSSICLGLQAAHYPWLSMQTIEHDGSVKLNIRRPARSCMPCPLGYHTLLLRFAWSITGTLSAPPHSKASPPSSPALQQSARSAGTWCGQLTIPWTTLSRSRKPRHQSPALQQRVTEWARFRVPECRTCIFPVLDHDHVVYRLEVAFESDAVRIRSRSEDEAVCVSGSWGSGLTTASSSFSLEPCQSLKRWEAHWHFIRGKMA